MDGRILYVNLLFLLAILFSIQLQISSVVTPIKLKFNNKVTVHLDRTLKLECPIRLKKNNSFTKKNLMYNWYFNDIPFNRHLPRLTLSNDDSILQLEKIQFDDAGEYKCEGISGFGRKEAKMIVYVIDDKFCLPNIINRYNKKRRKMKKITWKRRFKPCFIMHQNLEIFNTRKSRVTSSKIITINRNINESVELDCSSLGNPAITYVWWQDGFSAEWIHNVTGVRGPILRIPRLQFQNSGHYKCFAKNVHGQITFSYILIVNSIQSTKLKFVQKIHNVTAKNGTRVELIAKIACNCKPTVQWLREETNPSKDKTYIQIPNARPEERGKFYSILEADAEVSLGFTVLQDRLTEWMLVIYYLSKRTSGKYVIYVTMNTDKPIYQTAFITLYNPNIVAKPIKHSRRFMLFILIPLAIIIIYPTIVLFCWLRKRHQGRPFSLLWRSNGPQPPPPHPSHQTRLINTKSNNTGPSESVVASGSTTSSSGTVSIMQHQQAQHQNNLGGMMSGINPNHTTGTVSTILSSSNTNRQTNQIPNNSMIIYPNNSTNMTQHASSIPLVTGTNMSANNTPYIHQTSDMNGGPNGGQILMPNDQHHYPLPAQSNHSGSGNSSVIEQQPNQTPQHRIGYITPNSAAIITTSTNNNMPQKYSVPTQNHYNQYYTGAPTHHQQQPSIDFFPHSSSSPSNTYSY